MQPHDIRLIQPHHIRSICYVCRLSCNSVSSDSESVYGVCRWVPELKRLPTRHIHSPWDAPSNVLETAKVSLGSGYPHRVSTRDLVSLRARNVSALRSARQKWKQKVPEDTDSDGYDVIRVSKDAARSIKRGRVRVFTVPALRRSDEGLVGRCGDDRPTQLKQHSSATDTDMSLGASARSGDEETATQVTASKRLH